MNKIYTIIARRYGNSEGHTYIAGVSNDVDQAIFIAKEEEIYRNGKYECEILEWSFGENEIGTKGQFLRKVKFRDRQEYISAKSKTLMMEIDEIEARR